MAKQVISTNPDIFANTPYNPGTIPEVPGVGPVERGRLQSGTEFIQFRDYATERSIAQQQALAFEQKIRQGEKEQVAAKQRLDHTRYTYRYSPQQEVYLKQLNDSMSKIDLQVARQEMTAEQAQNLKRQLELETQAVLPQKQRVGPSPEDMFMSRTVVDPVTKKRFMQNSKGDYEEIHTGVNVEPKVFAGWYKELKETMPEGTPPEVINQELKAMMASYQQVMGNISGQAMQAEMQQPQQRPRPQAGFDPFSDRYDILGATEAGLKPDETKHMGSLDPQTGRLLKGINHETIQKTFDAEKKMDNKIVFDKGAFYSVPESDPRQGLTVEEARKMPQTEQIAKATIESSGLSRGAIQKAVEATGSYSEALRQYMAKKDTGKSGKQDPLGAMSEEDFKKKHAGKKSIRPKTYVPKGRYYQGYGGRGV